MDASGLAVSLVVVAASIIDKLIKFRRRMNKRETWLTHLMGAAEAHLLAAQNVERRLDLETGGKMPERHHLWYPIAQDLLAMRSHLSALDDLLQQLHAMDTETIWDRLMTQKQTDRARVAVENIFHGIRDTIGLMSLNLQLALNPPLQSPTRTEPEPDSESWRLARRESEASTIAVEEDPIVTACRALDAGRVQRLLTEDSDLLCKKDDRGLTLLDIVICQGGRTHVAGASQLRLVRLFASAKVRFTLQNYPEYSKTYQELIQTIASEDQMKRRDIRKRR